MSPQELFYYDNDLHPIAFYSKVLKPHERKYNTAHKEYLSILFATRMHRNYLLDRKERCRLTIENPPPRVSSIGHFFLERGPNPKNFCCLGQSSIS
jgi:hypothetical protein